MVTKDAIDFVPTAYTKIKSKLFEGIKYFKCFCHYIHEQYLPYIYIYTLSVTKYFREDRYIHYLKSARIWSFFRPYFAAFGLCILFKCGKIRTRKTPNTGTFHAVVVVVLVVVVLVVVVLVVVVVVVEVTSCALMFFSVALMLHLEVTLGPTFRFFPRPNVTYCYAIDLYNLNERGNSRKYFSRR